MQAQKDSYFYTVHVQWMRGSKKKNKKQITAGGYGPGFYIFCQNSLF